MNAFENFEVWFITGAQLLYGGDAVIAVDSHSNEMVKSLNEQGGLPVKIVYKGTVNSAKEVTAAFKEANNDPKCIGVITWMHTFSPAKMWIHGLQEYRKPLMHLHTQFNREIPWDTMDMDFMNLNQSAHGDREFGHITARMRKPRKVVVGHWSDKRTQEKIAIWMRVAAAWADAQELLIIRLGDQMNNVAVTDGDKVDAEMRLGYHVDYCPIAELGALQEKVTDDEIAALMLEYESQYAFSEDCKAGGAKHGQVVKAARIEIALRRLLQIKGAKAFTTNFDDLEDIDQIPGLASQRLMAEGYGFGAEGDWKTAALYRTMWFMSQGMTGGCSFMEDYTLHFSEAYSAILQAHMLEVCPLIAAEDRPRMDVFPLGIGGKNDPARLIFTSKTGPGLAATIVDMGNRFRMIVNKVDCIKPQPLPKLPVASALWIPRPDFETGAGAWILAGGTHHTSFSYDLTVEYMEDYAEIAGIELLVIDENTTMTDFKKEIRMNEIYFKLIEN